MKIGQYNAGNISEKEITAIQESVNKLIIVNNTIDAKLEDVKEYTLRLNETRVQNAKVIEGFKSILEGFKRGE